MEKENKRQNVKPRGRLKGEQVKESVSVLFPVIVTICLSNPGKHFHFLTCKTYFRTNTSHFHLGKTSREAIRDHSTHKIHQTHRHNVMQRQAKSCIEIWEI
jgi:hypothetical protein